MNICRCIRDREKQRDVGGGQKEEEEERERQDVGGAEKEEEMLVRKGLFHLLMPIKEPGG